MTGRAGSALVLLIAATCGGAATAPAAKATGTVTPTATVAATVSAAGPWTFTVDPSSKVTVRVREVLARVQLPGDAVLTATGMKGSFTLNGDGTFAPSSKITIDLTTRSHSQSSEHGNRRAPALN